MTEDQNSEPNRTIKQVIYPHGGSRIYRALDDDSDRELLIDTYAEDAEFALAAMKFVEGYFATKLAEISKGLK